MYGPRWPGNGRATAPGAGDGPGTGRGGCEGCGGAAFAWRVYAGTAGGSVAGS
ncbi:hypothetical protein GA0115257_102538 [Streptomyces sp. LcepLS]|nr:hypothetical protein GA0115251_143216 [Streptomyces sp. TverLS-915]SCE78250.1 hypothetical protein GA0115257_102538 [Streptomyces sp. LcepLS]